MRYGINVKLGPEVSVFAGYGIHHYAFDNREDGRAFIDENWPQFDAAWRRRTLSVSPLPPFVTVPGRYLRYGRSER